MSDNTPKEEVQGIPQELADDLAALAADVSAMSSRASRGWKITAAVWVILLCVIAGYLYLIVYAPLKELLEPESVVQLGINTINSALESRGVPRIDESTRLAQWASTQIKDAAPGFMRDRVKPQIDTLLARLPEERIKWTQRFREEGPVWINDAVQHFGEEVLPAGNEALLDLVDEKVDEILAQFGDQIDAIIGQVIDTTGGMMEETGLRNDQPELRARIESAFEDAMGPVLDEVMADLDEKVSDTGVAIGELVEKYNARRLTHKEKLEVRLIQLTMALFEGALEELPAESGMIEQLRAALQQAGMPMIDQNAAIERVRQAEPTGRPQTPEEILQSIPEEYREGVRKRMAEDAAPAAEAAQAAE